MNGFRMVLPLSATGGGGGNDDDAPSPRPDMLAQRLELRDRFARYHAAHVFAPGDLVAEKEGLGTIRDGERTALIYWRDLDPTDALDAAIIEDFAQHQHTNAVDCMVGRLPDDAASVVIHPHDSSRLRPLTAEERAELDAVAGGDEPAEGGAS